jgi:rSAM/selenodomain-associated transferase 1
MNSKPQRLSPGKKHPGATGRCALTIMTKAPVEGRVKTRLSPPLTATEAAILNRCFLQDTATEIAGAGEGTWGIGCYTPIGTEDIFSGLFPASFALLPQQNGDFGERLRGALGDLFSIGFASVCLIASDSPTVSRSIYAQAARLLSQPDGGLVLGPSRDGGYYLIGMKQLHARLFEDIAWSGNEVFTQTMARAAELQLPVQLLPLAFDVDDRSSLQQLCNELLGRPVPSQSAAVTTAFLQDLISREGRDRIWPVDLSSPTVL